MFGGFVLRRNLYPITLYNTNITPISMYGGYSAEKDDGARAQTGMGVAGRVVWPDDGRHPADREADSGGSKDDDGW